MKLLDNPGLCASVGPFLGIAFDGFVMGHGISWWSVVNTTTLAAGFSLVVDLFTAVARGRRLRQS